MNRILISICGGSGCGKSSLAGRLVECLGVDRAARIPGDYYLKSNPYPTLAEFRLHPLQYDWDLIESELQQADGTPISSPNFDFIHFRRNSAGDGRPFVLRPILILDAMVPYPKAHLTVLIQCPDDERRRRIIERDQRWKTQVIENWELHQVTLADMLRRRSGFDLELDGRESAEVNLEKILALPLLASRIGAL